MSKKNKNKSIKVKSQIKAKKQSRTNDKAKYIEEYVITICACLAPFGDKYLINKYFDQVGIYITIITVIIWHVIIYKGRRPK